MMMNKGFAPIIILIITALVAAGVITTYSIVSQKATTPLPTPQEIVTEPPLVYPEVSLSPSPKLIATKTPSPKPVTLKTATPKPTIVSTPIPTQACNYNLNDATGAIQFIFNPTKGSTLYWSTVAEIKAQNGCKVLDGRSTDIIQRFKSSGSNSLSIPSIPSGTYEVRYSYHDSWSSSQSVSVTSGQQVSVNYSVNNSTDP